MITSRRTRSTTVASAGRRRQAKCQSEPLARIELLEGVCSGVNARAAGLPEPAHVCLMIVCGRSADSDVNDPVDVGAGYSQLLARRSMTQDLTGVLELIGVLDGHRVASAEKLRRHLYVEASRVGGGKGNTDTSPGASVHRRRRHCGPFRSPQTAQDVPLIPLHGHGHSLANGTTGGSLARKKGPATGPR